MSNEDKPAGSYGGSPGSASAATLASMQDEWNEERERARFEDAFYAHYLRRRAERNQRGQIGVLDNAEAPHPREMLFCRERGGEYTAIAVQHAWGGWQLARGGL